MNPKKLIENIGTGALLLAALYAFFALLNFATQACHLAQSIHI